MNTKLRVTTWIVVILVLLASAVLLSGFPAKGNRPAETGELVFDFSSPRNGWMIMQSRLYRTEDAGKNWADISPYLEYPAEIRSAAFIGTSGRVVLTQVDEKGAYSYFLAKSEDNGDSWKVDTLTLFDSDENWILPQSIHLFFLDDQRGWLVIRHATSSNFNVGSLFRTEDGGLTWKKLSIPIGEKVVFTDPELGFTVGGATGQEAYRSQDGGETWAAISPDSTELPVALLTSSSIFQAQEEKTVQLDVLSETTAWALFSNGECRMDLDKTSGECTSRTSLQLTSDGGATWQVVSLPGISSGVLEKHTEFSSASQPFGLEMGPSLTQAVTGQGFDICEIPNLARLGVWWRSSPYTAVNLYIGGSARACANVNLTASYLAQLQQQGWKFIPTWVGPQAPCTTYRSRMPWYDPYGTVNAPYLAGIANAIAALDVAEQLGLTGPDKSGTVIYYDIETFNTENTQCVDSVRHFMIGWTEEMESFGSVSGVYANASSGIYAFAYDPLVPASYVYPKAAWIPYWLIPPMYRTDVLLFDISGINDSWWPNHQRIRQYAGDHAEVWGNIVLNSIDSNIMDGVIATRAVALGNDDIEAAKLISSAPYADGREIGLATSAADDPLIPCLSGPGFQSAWYRFTPSVSGKAVVSTAGSDYDTVLALWTGTRGSLVAQGCSDDQVGLQAEIQVDLAGGATYYIEVAAKSAVTTGKLFLSLHMPANDDINAAIPAPGVPFSHSMSTTGASDSTDDPAVPVCNLVPGRNSVWYSFTPTTSGPVSLDTLGSNYDTYLAVWSGSRGALALVGCNNDLVVKQSRLEVTLAANTRYFIEVGQFDGSLTVSSLGNAGPALEPVGGGSLSFHITSFYDVPGTHTYWSWVEQLKASGITGGCAINPQRFCPDSLVTRAQMALFLLRGIHDSMYSPPLASGSVFSDVPVTHWAAAWIEQLALEKITAGCGGGKFCPEANVTRAQMAVFLLRAKYGSLYTPPPVTTTRFTDVPGTHWAAAWIEQLAAEGITGGCGTNLFCPDGTVKRGEMAVFLVRTFNLP